MKFSILFILSIFAFPINAEAAPSLTISGECPGVVTTTVSDVTPDSRFSIFTGTEGGTYTFGGGPCTGATLDLGPTTFLRNLPVDASGSVELNNSISRFRSCGEPMQVLDMADCSVSNVANNPVIADNDGDGFDETNGDCDDGNALVHPHAVEICDNGIDDNCDGSVDTHVLVEDNFDSGLPSSVMINGDGYHGYVGTDGYISLTEESGNQAATVFMNRMVDGNKFNIGVEVYLGNNTGGADGMAIIIADTFKPWFFNPYKRADAFGVNGLSGYAVTLDTYENLESGDPSGNFIGLVELGAHPYPYIATNNTIPTLEDGTTHYVEISMDHGMIEVWLDGVSYMNAEIPGYTVNEAMIGVSGATGGLTNYQSMDDLYVGCEAP
jgi:hypothetical protein